MKFFVLDPAGMEAVPWEGGLPGPTNNKQEDEEEDGPYDGLLAAGFVPVEVAAGSLVCFPGTLDHLSLPNYSTLPRHTFQLHMVEGPAAGVEWSKENWQPQEEGKEFVRVH